MKHTLIKVTLAALAVVMLGSCEKINQRIDALEGRIDGIENEKIATISSQIASINSSIADLGTIRSNVTSLRSQVDDHSTDIFNLEEADRALQDRILNLEDYLDDVLPTYAEKDWVKATFSTLAQYEATCDTIAKIDARIGKLDERLSKDIKDCVDSMKRWVNVQFEAYYTAAEMDAALEYMQAEIDSLKSGSSDYKLDSLANELTKTKAAVDSAKAQLTREYKAAIDTAITHLEGNFDRKLQQEIEKVNADITALTTRVSNLEVSVATLTGRVTDLEGMIQSVTIVPAYSDGSVKATKDGLLYLDIIVEPATAVAGLTKDKLKVLVNEVKTKAVSIDTVEVADIKVDVAKGTITARANISSKLPVESGKALTIAVNVKNGISDHTTEFCPVTLSTESNVTIEDKQDTTKVTISADEDFPKSVMANIAVNDGFNENKPTDIKMGGIGTVTFDNIATSKIKTNAQNEGSTNVFFKVEDVTESKPVAEANLVYEVTMKTVDEQGTEVFAEGKAAGVATVSVPLGEEVKSVQSVSLVDESGRQISGGVVDGSVQFTDGILTFKVKHFSRYAIKYTLKENVAQIGNQKFTSLAKAIDAAQEGDIIQMIADFATTDNVTVGADKNIILDLNGKTIRYTTDGHGSFIENKGQLKVMDSGQNGIITANFSAPNWNAGCYTINNAGTYEKAGKLVIESGTIENTSPATGLAWPINNGIWGTKAELIINGGTIHSVNYVPVREYLQYGGKKTIVINGGKFISDNSRAIAVQVNDATIEDTGSYVTINGGEFTCNGSGILYIDLHAANVNMTGFTMTVNDGQFKNSNTDAPVLVYDYEGNPQTSAVLLSGILKGGIYSKEPASELIAFGYHIEENTDTQTKSDYPWRVAANSAEGADVSVSKPGQTTVYSTLAAFRDDVNAGETFQGYTVTVLKDIDLTDDTWVPIGTDLYTNPARYFAGTFDGNNHTIKLKKTEIDGDYGLFMQIWGEEEDDYAIVKNLKLDVDLSSKTETKTWIGGLTDCAGGYLRFENIEVTGNITSGRYAGGFVGFDIYDGLATFENCVNKADITVVHPTATSDVYSLVGGFVAQFDYTTLNFISCRNEGKLKADHTSAPSGASYMGHMAAKSNYKNDPLDIIITNCSFSENAEISGWNVKSKEINSYPFEGKILGTDEYTYGAGTPNRGKQMIGGYFKSCSLDGVVQDWTYPNGNN